MSIRIRCPNCHCLVAYEDEKAGTPEHCLNCGLEFILPQVDMGPVTVPEHPESRVPQPGFYRALFIDSWNIFVRKQNVTTLVFVLAVVCFKFFLSSACCLGFVAFVVIWGWLFGFYLNLIYNTAMDEDDLPEIFLGEGVGFLVNIFKPFWLFSFALFVVLLPFYLCLYWLNLRGGEPTELLQFQWSVILIPQFLFIAGLCLFPVAILTIAVGEDILLLRPNYLIRPVRKAPWAYMTVCLVLLIACVAELHTRQGDLTEGFGFNAMHLGVNIVVQVLLIIAMRGIGLFYRHYSCFFKW